MTRSTRGAYRESGYTLVALAVAVTVLSVLVAAAMPVWKQISQRQKEEELIFRGWQYAEAIRVFQQRHGRLPTRLEELEKVEPRSIRRLWEDPITDSDDWGLVFQGQQGGQLRGEDLAGGNAPGGPGQGRGGRDDEGRRGDRRRGGRPGDGERRTVGPIVGVHSRSTDASIKVLFDEEQYDRWIFTVDKLTRGSRNVQVGVGADVRRSLASVWMTPARWIGRPFREGLNPERGTPGQPPRAGSGRGRDGRPPGARPFGGGSRGDRTSQ